MEKEQEPKQDVRALYREVLGRSDLTDKEVDDFLEGRY